MFGSIKKFIRGSIRFIRCLYLVGYLLSWDFVTTGPILSLHDKCGHYRVTLNANFTALIGQLVNAMFEIVIIWVRREILGSSLGAKQFDIAISRSWCHTDSV